METGDQASLLEAEEIQKKVHLESLRIVQEERSVRAKLATEECSVVELEKLVSVQRENMDKLQLSIQSMKQCIHVEETHQAEVEELSKIYIEICQQLQDYMTQISISLNMAIQEKEKLTEVFISQQQEIDQMRERKHEQELLHTKKIEQLHQLLIEEQAEAAREATGQEDAKKAKARLEKRCEEESQQASARLEVGSQLLLASSEQCSQLLLVHSKLAIELTVSNADIASLAKLKQQTEIRDKEQLARSTAEVGTWTRVLQERIEELQVEQVEMAQLQQEEATALQHIQVLESGWRVSLSELEQLRAQDIELKAALEGAERDEASAKCNLQVSETEKAALEQLIEGLGAELEELQTKKEILGCQLQQEWSSDTLDLESHCSQVGELKNDLQQKQKHLLTVLESLHVQQQECRKAEENAKANGQKISQLQTQVLCMQAERLAAGKVTADLSGNITNLDEKRASLEVNLAEASESLMEQRRLLTEDRNHLAEERAQSILAEKHWHSLREREQEEASRLMAHNREKQREAHKDRIESLTREYEDWEPSEVTLEKQAYVTLEHKLQTLTKEAQVLDARLMHNQRKKTLFHTEKGMPEIALLPPCKAALLPPCKAALLPPQRLPPYKRSVLKPKCQESNTQAKLVLFFESDVSTSSMEIGPQEEEGGPHNPQGEEGGPHNPQGEKGGLHNPQEEEGGPQPLEGIISKK